MLRGIVRYVVRHRMYIYLMNEVHFEREYIQHHDFFTYAPHFEVLVEHF